MAGRKPGVCWETARGGAHLPQRPSAAAPDTKENCLGGLRRRDLPFAGRREPLHCRRAESRICDRHSRRAPRMLTPPAGGGKPPTGSDEFDGGGAAEGAGAAHRRSAPGSKAVAEASTLPWHERDGVALFYEEASGGAPPLVLALVLVHGLGCDHRHMAHPREAFAGGHRIVTPARAGAEREAAAGPHDQPR